MRRDSIEGWSQVVKGFESHAKEFGIYLKVFEEGKDINILTLIQSLNF